MYKDKEKASQASKERMRRYRALQKATKGVTMEGVTEQGVTYPAIIIALADPIKKEKLESITKSLKAHNVAHQVNYGIGGPDFSIVGDMLDALKAT